MELMAIDSRYYVANVRHAPKFGDNIVGIANQSDPVAVTGPKQGDRWLPCLVQVEGETVSAFVSKNVLRKRGSVTRERLMRVCVSEYIRFDRGKGKEQLSPYSVLVGEYWASLGINLDGTDQDTPWSAAFISYCIKSAGGYSGFKFSAAHSKYVNQAIRRKLDSANGPFWGYRINERKPELGDIICRSREGSKIQYDFAADNNAYRSHCDIVIRKTINHVSTLGGNVSNSVTRSNYPLNTSGYIASSSSAYAVLKNNR